MSPRTSLVLTSVFLFALHPARAAEPAAEPPGEVEHHHHPPMPLDEYIACMEDPERDKWQKPEELLAALALKPGERILDLGAGPGYFALRIARAVTGSGHVFAADIEPGMLTALIDRMKKAGVKNITPVLVPPDDTTLPEASVDMVFICDTYHHLEDRAHYLERLRRVVRKDGRLVIVDFHKKKLPVGPPVEMKIDGADVKREVEGAGYKLEKDLGLLPYQYVLIFSPR